MLPAGCLLCLSFHSFLAFFLFFEELSFAADVASVAFGYDVFAEGGDGLPGDDFGADGGLGGYIRIAGGG